MYWECAYTYVYIYIYHTGGLLSTVASIYAHASGYWSSGLRVSFFFFFLVYGYGTMDKIHGSQR